VRSSHKYKCVCYRFCHPSEASCVHESLGVLHSRDNLYRLCDHMSQSGLKLCQRWKISVPKTCAWHVTRACYSLIQPSSCMSSHQLWPMLTICSCILLVTIIRAVQAGLGLFFQHLCNHWKLRAASIGFFVPSLQQFVRFDNPLALSSGLYTFWIFVGVVLQ